MENKPSKPRKVRTTLALTLQAQNIIFDYGYASPRTVGEFISNLIVDYHARKTRKPTRSEIAQEMRRLADLLDTIDS